jgi:hypothetical protein
MPPRVKLGTGRRQGRGLVCGGDLPGTWCQTPAQRLGVAESRVMNARAGSLVLELKFVVDAPRRERIFRALTEPTELAKWWGHVGSPRPR